MTNSNNNAHQPAPRPSAGAQLPSAAAELERSGRAGGGVSGGRAGRQRWPCGSWYRTPCTTWRCATSPPVSASSIARPASPSARHWFHTPADTYGRAIWVGLLNTLRVAVIGIVLATILGTLIGIGRLSKNWLIAKITSIYVEVMRNVPLLLQLFFWYALITENMPGPRQAHNPLPGVFISNRGLKVPGRRATRWTGCWSGWPWPSSPSRSWATGEKRQEATGRVPAGPRRHRPDRSARWPAGWPAAPR